MNLKSFLIIALFCSFSAISQTNFVSGYIIQTNGTKVNCLIKNEDWKESPKTFEYKLGENGEVTLGSVDNIVEFGSGDSFKYVKATLEIDQSSDTVGNLSDERNPLMKKETLFLKVLLEGKASLYYSEREIYPRYFFKVNDGNIEQLVYKRYMATPTRMGTNEYYKQQLATALNCDKLTESSFGNLEYKKNKLINIITNYNTCESSETVQYKKKDRKAAFNLSIRPGATFSSLSIQKSGDEEVEFGNNTGLRLGLEAEYIFPFNNAKWSLFIEPTYRSYKAEKEVVYVDYFTIQKTTLVTATYNSVEVPVGGRHYMFLNNEAAIFIDAALIVDVTVLDSEITSSNENGYDLQVNADTALAFGIGFRYNKYSIEARYHTSRQLLNYDNISSSFNSFSLIAGYKFL